MIPYILAAVGGYLIGQSQKKDVPQMGKGGTTDLEKYHNENGPYITEMELDEYFQKSVDGYKKEDFFNVAENMGYEYDEDSDQYIKMAKGGVLVGRFYEKQLRNGEDKKAIEKKMKETGLKYIDTKMVKKAGKIVAMDVYLIDEETYLKQPLMADGGMMAKGGKIPEKEVESLKRYTMKWYGKDGIDDDEDADFKPPVTQKEVEDAVSEYVRFCKKAMSEGNESKWGGGDSFDREVVADIMQYNRNPEADTFFYPELIKEIKNIDGKMPMMYAKGGKTKSKKFEFQVMFYDGSGDLIDSEYYVDDPSDKEVIQLAKKLDAKTGQLYRDKYESGEYMELVADYDFIDEYAKGGKVKSKKWIQDALGGDEGSLRRTAKRKGLLKGDENLSMTDLKKLQKMGGKTAKRAHLAETLRKFDDGGTMN